MGEWTSVYILAKDWQNDIRWRNFAAGLRGGDLGDGGVDERAARFVGRDRDEGVVIAATGHEFGIGFIRLFENDSKRAPEKSLAIANGKAIEGIVFKVDQRSDAGFDDFGSEMDVPPASCGSTLSR